MKRRVIELCYRDAAGVLNTRYISDRGLVTETGQTPANTVIEGRAMNNIVVGWAVSCIIWGNATSTTLGVIDIANADGSFDAIAGETWRDCPVYVHEIEDGTSLSPATRVGAAVVDQIQAVDDQTLRVVSFDKAQQLEVELASDVYGAGVANVDIQGTARPLIFGNVENIRPILIDQQNLIYEFNGEPENQLLTVRESGATLIETTDYTVADQTFTLLASPAGQITASVARSATSSITLLESDILLIGDMDTWSGGEPDGWTIVNNTNGTLEESSGGGELAYDWTASADNSCTITSDNFIQVVQGAEYQFSFNAIDDIDATNAVIELQILDVIGNPLNSNAGTLTGQGVRTLNFIAPANYIRIRITFAEVFAVASGPLRFDDLTIRRSKTDSGDGLPDLCGDLIFRAGFEAGDFDSTEADALQASRDYALNLFADPERPIVVREALQEVVDSVAGWLYTDLAGKFAVGRIEPATGTPALEINIDELDGAITRELDRAPGLTARLAVDRNWHPHPSGSVVGSVEAQEAQRLEQDHLKVIEATDVERLAPEYKHAKSAPPRPTLLRDFGDGTCLAEIDEQVGLYAQTRCFYRLAGVLDREAFSLQPDAGPIRLVGNRYGLEHGTDVRLVGVRARRGEETADLLCWGTLGRFRCTSVGPFTGTERFTNAGGSGTSYPASRYGIASTWFKSNGANTTVGIIVMADGNSFGFYMDTIGRIFIIGENAGGTNIMSVRTVAEFDDSQWHHAIAWCDTSAQEYAIFIDGRQEQLVEVTSTSDTIGAIDGGDIGNNSAGSQPFDGYVASPFLHIGSACNVDIYDPAVRALFADALRRPVYAGAEGSLPLGEQPAIYMAEIPTNLGGLGDFTEVGTVDEGLADSPTVDAVPPASYRRHHAPALDYTRAGTGLNYYATSGTVTTADSTKVSACMVIRFNALNAGSNQFALDWGSRGLQLYFNGAEELNAIIDDAAGTTIGHMQSAVLALASYYAVLISINTETGVGQLYIDDVDGKDSTPTAIVSDSTAIDFTVTGSVVVGNATAKTTAAQSDAAIAHLGVCTGVALDFSIPAIRRRFFDRYNRPVFGGADGSLAFGQAPEIWIPDGNPARNAGTLANAFALTGAVDLADSYPTDA